MTCLANIMNRKKRIKHRNPNKSPIVIKYRECTNDREREEYKKNLSRKNLKKLNKV